MPSCHAVNVAIGLANDVDLEFYDFWIGQARKFLGLS